MGLGYHIEHDYTSEVGVSGGGGGGGGNLKSLRNEMLGFLDALSKQQFQYMVALAV